jgi:hypothetical protein
MATIYRADGTQEEVQPADGTCFTLKEAQWIVHDPDSDPKCTHSYVEVIPTTTSGIIMIVNEESKLLGLPRNNVATTLAGFMSRDEFEQQVEQVQASGDTDVIRVGYDADLMSELQEGESDYVSGTVLVCTVKEFR